MTAGFGSVLKQKNVELIASDVRINERRMQYTEDQRNEDNSGQTCIKVKFSDYTNVFHFIKSMLRCKGVVVNSTNKPLNETSNTLIFPRH